MPDYHRQQPIHPADCGCPRCWRELPGERRRHPLEVALIGLIVAASFVCAALAISGAN